jgi:hypothetical protein
VKAGCEALRGNPAAGEGLGMDVELGGLEETICSSSERRTTGMLIGFVSDIVGSVGLGVTGVPEIRNISNDENLII